MIDSVSPHHASIAAKYMAFSDMELRPGLYKYVVYEDELASEDMALLATVVDLISFQKLSETGGVHMIHH